MTPETVTDADKTVHAVDPHHITAEMLEILGLGQIAYVRAGHTPQGVAAAVIHAANGDVLGFAENEAVARAAALQNDLHAFSVH
jgi:hypothetical protein